MSLHRVPELAIQGVHLIDALPSACRTWILEHAGTPPCAFRYGCWQVTSLTPVTSSIAVEDMDRDRDTTGAPAARFFPVCCYGRPVWDEMLEWLYDPQARVFVMSQRAYAEPFSCKTINEVVASWNDVIGSLEGGLRALS